MSMIGSAGLTTPPDRVDVELVHGPVLGRPDVDPLQLVFGRDLAFDVFRQLALDLAQFARDLAAQILVDLDDLELGLADLSLGLGGRGDERTALAFETSGVALERRHALDGNQVLAPQIAHALEFLADEFGFALLGRDLAGEALDFFTKLRRPLPELRLLSGPRCPAQLEDFCSPEIIRPTSGKDFVRARSSAGKTTAAASSRSASSRAWRDSNSSMVLRTIARFACVTVSSRRMTTSPP
jgi:hypothetical protein